MEDYLITNNKQLFDKAYKLACKVHKNQKRDDGAPYITHIDGIINILTKELHLNDYILLSVTALHDVLEDSDIIIYKDIEAEFGKSIAEKVKLLTKIKGMTLVEYLNNMEKYEFKTLILQVKLADRLHNVRSLKLIVESKIEKVKRYIIETENYYIPLAKKYNILFSELKIALEEVKRKVESYEYTNQT